MGRGGGRRRFLYCAGALFAATVEPHLHAQPATRPLRVGYVLSTSPLAEMLGPEPTHEAVRSFLAEMRSLGYVEGHNFVLERRSAEGRYERYEAIFAELIRLKCDVLLTVTVEMTLAAKRLTKTVPIVFVMSSAGGDPVAAGIVPNLRRPGGNITGYMADAGPEIFGKRLELMKQIAPRVARVAFLGLAHEWDSPGGRSVRAAANALGITLFEVVARPNDYAGAFEIVERERGDAVFVSGHPAHFAARQQIVDFAAARGLPTSFSFPSVPEDGALMAYGAAPRGWLRAAEHIARIAKGEKPGDLPIERPTRFDLVINLRTARALGLAIAPALLLQADRVIE